MTIANYSTSIAPEKTAGEIMGMLARHGATNISIAYTNGRATGMTFSVATQFGEHAFSLPVRAEGVLKAC